MPSAVAAAPPAPPHLPSPVTMPYMPRRLSIGSTHKRRRSRRGRTQRHGAVTRAASRAALCAQSVGSGPNCEVVVSRAQGHLQEATREHRQRPSLKGGHESYTWETHRSMAYSAYSEGGARIRHRYIPLDKTNYIVRRRTKKNGTSRKYLGRNLSSPTNAINGGRRGVHHVLPAECRGLQVFEEESKMFF